MEIWITRNTKKKNSTKVISIDPTYSIQFTDVQARESVSLAAPVFILRGYNQYWAFNYVYCVDWKRYYWIEDVTVDGNLQYLQCSEDFLASWADNIRYSTLYCVRSAVRTNDLLTDTLFPAPNNTQTEVYRLANPWKDITDGYYVVAIASGDNDVPHIGTNSYYIFDTAGMTNFMKELMSSASVSSIGDIGTSIVKAMVNPMQYIRSCYWFPCFLDAEKVSVSTINFGWWSSDTSATVIDLTDNQDSYTLLQEIFYFNSNLFPDSERSYLKYAPYSTLTLTAYPFGKIEIPRALLTEYITAKTPIVCDIYVDHITGMAELILTNTETPTNFTPYYVQTCQLAVEIPVGEILQDYAGSIISGVAAAGAALTGNVVGAAAGVYNALDSITPTTTVTGMAGGFAQLMLHEPWTLTREHYTPTISTDLLGEPLCRDISVNDLDGGYAKFSDVEIEGPMLGTEKDALKKQLESGVFLEFEGD